MRPKLASSDLTAAMSRALIAWREWIAGFDAGTVDLSGLAAYRGTQSLG
jgi:hypothetical protein